MHARLMLTPLVCLAAAAPAQATVYLSLEQAQALMFPGAMLMQEFRDLTPAQQQAIAQDAGVPVSAAQLQAWRAPDGGWFLLDAVIGKHSPIRYAVALDAHGAVRQVEILEYQESYGGEVRLPAWRRQFIGRTHAQPPQLDANVRNISGATLSCRHVTDGVRRLLSSYALVLAGA